jgi:hypothetical protein
MNKKQIQHIQEFVDKHIPIGEEYISTFGDIFTKTRKSNFIGDLKPTDWGIDCGPGYVVRQHANDEPIIWSETLKPFLHELSGLIDGIESNNMFPIY